MSSYLQSSYPGLTRCEWQWGLWAAQQAPFLFSSSVQNWVSQFSCPLSFRAEGTWEPRADHLTPSDQQGFPFWSFPLLSVLFSSPFPKESAILWSKGSSFSSSEPSPGGKGGLGWQESDSKILQTATTAADQGTDLPDGQNTHGEPPHASPQGRETFPSEHCPGPDQSRLGQVDTFPGVAVCTCVTVTAGDDHLRLLLSPDLAQAGASLPPHTVPLSTAPEHLSVRCWGWYLVQMRRSFSCLPA